MENILSRVLLVCDRPHWAYDSIAKALCKYNQNPQLQLDIAYIKGITRFNASLCLGYDVIFVLGWQVLGEFQDAQGNSAQVTERFSFLDPAKTLMGIHSHHGWDNRRTQPGHWISPPQELIHFLKRYRGVNAVSRRLWQLFRDAELANVFYTPNGVDTEVFQPIQPIQTEGPLRVGFSGNQKHDWRKGITEFIKPSCNLPGVELKLAYPQEGYVPHDEMPRFYNDIDVYLCASSSEGFSLSVLEASASGRPIISTRVGGSEELIDNGINGFLVDRSVEAIREKIKYFLAHRHRTLEMGAENRRIVTTQWGWKQRAPAWLQFITTHLRQVSSIPSMSSVE